MKSAHSPVSASEMNADITCSRVWAARYRAEDWPDRRGGKHFAVGSAFHKLCENYARHGTIPTENTSLGQMFLAALPYLPAPGTWTRLENHDTYTVDGVPYLVIPDWAGPDMVLDFKTTKDLNGTDRETGQTYALTTKEQKLSDPQTVMYCYLYLPNGGTFRHLYVLKHRAVLIEHEDADPETCKAPIRPNARAADVYLTRAEIEEAFAAVVAPRARKLFQLRNKFVRIDPLSLDPNLASCEKYKNRVTGEGACAHIGRCFPQGKSMFAGLGTTEVVMSFQFKIVNESVPVETMSVNPVAEPVKVFPWQKPSVLAPAPAPEVIQEPIVQPEAPIAVDAFLSGTSAAGHAVSAPAPVYVPAAEDLSSRVTRLETLIRDIYNILKENV